MCVKLLTEHHLEFQSLKGGCIGSSESTLIKMPHCQNSHVAAQMVLTLCGPYATTAFISWCESNGTGYMVLIPQLQASVFLVLAKLPNYNTSE